MSLEVLSICAKSKREAIELFREWRINDNGLDKIATINSIEIVYNEYDAFEYGKEYKMLQC